MAAQEQSPTGLIPGVKEIQLKGGRGMKKNKMFRLASALLILVLLTTGIVGGTFAKYTTEGTGTDTARVAKWGVEVSTTGKAFQTEYTADEDVTDSANQKITNSVATSVTGEKLVAPGTGGDLFEASVTGKPEVAVTVSTSGKLTLTGWEYAPDPMNPTAKEEYCPIVITIDGTNYKMGAATDEANHVYGTIAEFQTAVEKVLSKTQNFAPNTDLAAGFSPSASWKWEFAGPDAAAYQTDAKDTALGNLAAGGTAPTIKLEYTVTVTQIN